MVMEFNSLEHLRTSLQGTGRNRVYDLLIRQHDGQFKFRDPGMLEGKATFRLEYAPSGSSFYAVPTVTRVEDPCASWVAKPIRMAYNLWGSHRLKAVQTEVAGADGAAQSIEALEEGEVKDIVASSWPLEPLEDALDRLGFRFCAPPDVIRSWLTDTGEGGAFDFRNLDHAHSRVTDKHLSLTFLRDGVPVRLELEWKPGISLEYKQAMAQVLAGTDDHTQRFGGYRNLPELVTQCLRQHVELAARRTILNRLMAGVPALGAVPTKIALEDQAARAGRLYLFLPVPLSSGSYDGDPLDVRIQMAVQRLSARCAEEARLRAEWALGRAAVVTVASGAAAAPGSGANSAAAALDVAALKLIDDHTGAALRSIREAQSGGWEAHRPHDFAGTLQQELAPDESTLKLLRDKGKTWANAPLDGPRPKRVKRSAHIPIRNGEPLPHGTIAVAFQNETSILRDFWLRLRTKIGSLMNRPRTAKPGRSYHRNGATGRLIEQQNVLLKQFVPSLRPPVPANKVMVAESRVAELAARNVYQGLPAFLHGFAGSLLDDKAHRLVLPEVRKTVEDAVQGLRNALHAEAMKDFTAITMPQLLKALPLDTPSHGADKACEAIYRWLRARAENGRAAEELIVAEKADAAWQATAADPPPALLKDVGAHHIDRMANDAAQAAVTARTKAGSAEQRFRLAGEQLGEVFDAVLGKSGFSEAARTVVASGILRSAPPDDAASAIVQCLIGASTSFDRGEAAIAQHASTLRNRLAMAAVGRATLGDFDRWDHNERQYALTLSKQAEVALQTGISEDPLPEDEAVVYCASTADQAVALNLLHRYSGRLSNNTFADAEAADVVGRVVVYRKDGEFEQVRDAEPPTDEADLPDASQNQNERGEEGSAWKRPEDYA